MDYTFHLQQGQMLLEKKDANSMKRALEHFKTANELIDEDDFGKPKTLFLLAIGNFMIGNLELSYKIAYKAKRCVKKAISNSPFSSPNLKEMIGENEIIGLIKHIEKNFSQQVMFVDILDDDFDENILDFKYVNKLYNQADVVNIKPNFTIETLSEEILIATFTGLSRTNDELIYFDKLNGDVVSYVNGYFSSLLGDQSISNRRLANRITNNEPVDLIDEDRFILIDRLILSDFLDEFKKQSKDKEPFLSFVDYFATEILKDYSYDDKLTINDLVFINHTQKKFHAQFEKKYQNDFFTLEKEYIEIFENACKASSINWIKNNILIKE
jgi:hypothetical protein